ncbi:MAG: hypothetical protein FJX20_23210 [Alphaproteobacteria bacterium]|nr:hypothetical protein [Alphaproteobacteria bacterium]
MSTSVIVRTLCAGVALAIVASAAIARAETKATAGPSPKASKSEGPDLDASKTRTPAKGKTWYSVPEKDDEVLVRSRRKGAK